MQRFKEECLKTFCFHEGGRIQKMYKQTSHIRHNPMVSSVLTDRETGYIIGGINYV